MSKFLSKTMIACSLALAGASMLTMPAAIAADEKKPAKAVKAKAKAKAEPKARAHPKAEDQSIPDGPDADITDTVTADYNCELGNKLTIFTNEKDETHIALRWKKRIHRLDKVGTTTGALRFENTTFGLTWIGIPSKGMLLDSKLNRQLANECKNAEQETAAAAPKPVEKQTEMPSATVKVKVEPIVPALPAPALDPAVPAAPAPATPAAPATAAPAAPAPAAPAVPAPTAPAAPATAVPAAPATVVPAAPATVPAAPAPAPAMVPAAPAPAPAPTAPAEQKAPI